jgi:outer membrane protein assembly factor BamB
MRRACRPSPAWLRWALPACAVLLFAPRPATGQCAGPEFGPFAGPNVSGEPWGVVAGDFWGATGAPDGTLDVVVAKKSANMVTLLRGDGVGSFLAPIDIPVGVGPTDLVAADFDRDGLLDLAVVVAAQALPPVNRVELLAGTGSGFGAPVPVDVVDLPSRLAVGDFNRDDKPDLVVVSWFAQTVQVYEGNGLLGFTLQTPMPVIPGDTPTAAVSGDFNLDGRPDLAVTLDNASPPDQVLIYLGDGTGHLGDSPTTEDPFATVTVGTFPLDIAVGDVNRDGKPDLVTADLGSVAVSVLIGAGNGTFTREPGSPAVGAGPIRAVLEDFDRDGLLDVATLNPPGGPPHVTVLPGTAVPPFFDAGSPTTLLLSPSSTHESLAAGDLNADGRPDLVATEGTDGNVVVALNTASPDCLRTSFLDAPRAFPGGNGPVSLAVADLDEDGIDDLVAAAQYGGTLELLRGTGNGYVPNGSVSPVPTPRGVAAADFDVNGNVDVAVAAGTEVRIYRGNGDGTLGGIPSTVGLGAAVWALVVGDFNEDGAPDVAAVTQGPNRVWILLGNGLGDLSVGNWYTTGGSPRSLATGPIGGGTTLDIVVANSAALGGVTVLLGNGDGTFTEPIWSPYDTTLAPWGVALADFDGDTFLDLATANWGTSQVSISPWDDPTPVLGFEEALLLTVVGQPIAVAALDVTGNTHADVMAVTGDLHTLWFREGNGDLSFQPEDSYPVRTRPSSIAPIDADADGRPDLAVPCRDADSVVVLLARPTGFARAPTLPTGPAPSGVVNADFDADGDLDVAVTNSGDGTVTVFENDGLGVFTPVAPTSPVGGANPQSLVVADFDRNGTLDLATVIPSDPGYVSVLRGNGDLTFDTAILYGAGSTPDDLVVADFNRDGAPDLAVCNKLNPTGQVTFLENNGGGGFINQGGVDVGNQPTSIIAADFNRDGRPDVAVANDNSNDLTVLYNDGTWAFPSSETLPLTGGDTTPVSLAGGDFDQDGDVDLVTVAFGSFMLSLYQNTGAAFSATPTRYDATFQPRFVIAADLNRDGKLDAAVAADGLKVLPGTGGLSFDPSEDVVAGRLARELAIGDFNGDGYPDVAMVNEDSNDVSTLLSSACRPRRLVLGMSPLSCGLGAPPYPVSATVWVEDDGGNLAICKDDEDIHAAIVPGTGTLGAVLGGTIDVRPTDGQAPFGDLTIDLAGPRYQLEFELPGVPKVFSRRFTLGASVAITGPPSVCAVETYTADPGFDSYHWTLTPSPTPSRFGPSTMVSVSDGIGSHTLDLVAHVDGCSPSDSRTVYVGDILSVNITPGGPVTVCVDCLGGPVTATEVGGGAPLMRQWGYRTVPIVGGITDIPGETGDTYVVNGLDFPGVGTFYLVETTTPTCGSPTTSNEVAVTITDMVPTGEVRSLGATSRGAPSNGENILQWVNSVGSPDDILVRWNKAPGPSPATCAPPPDPVTLAVAGEQLLLPPFTSKTVWPHGSLDLDTVYCYSIFVKVATVYSAGRTVRARPFDTSTGPVRWAYATGATAVVPPTVSEPGILVMSNDRSVHALGRGIGPLGGIWPPVWTPTLLNGVAHSRSPVVPFFLGPVGDNVPSDIVLFAGDDSGRARAINAETGQPTWLADPSFPSSAITGAPGGFFTQWGGPSDVILVGTRTLAPTGVFYTLNVNTGAVIDSFNALGNLGPITGGPTVDYTTGRVYFTSWSLGGSQPSVWCVQISGTGTILPATGWTHQNLGDIDASPVLIGGRLYVGNNAGMVYSLDAATGAPGPAFSTLGDGPVKGFLFPDRRGNDLYFATNTTVWSVRDTAGTLTTNWTFDDGGTLEPSIVLHWPQTDYLYVGGKDGRLIQLNFSGGPPIDPCTSPSCEWVELGGGLDHIGAPSLDIGVIPPDVTPGKKLLHVGSESGVLYAVEVPLP